jgi:hypothetical protein
MTCHFLALHRINNLGGEPTYNNFASNNSPKTDPLCAS